MEIINRIKDRSAVVCVVGVVYVGFPRAEAFSEHLKVIGYDLNSKAKTKLGWEPKIKFEELVEIMVKEDFSRWER